MIGAKRSTNQTQTDNKSILPFVRSIVAVKNALPAESASAESGTLRLRRYASYQSCGSARQGNCNPPSACITGLTSIQFHLCELEELSDIQLGPHSKRLGSRSNTRMDGRPQTPRPYSQTSMHEIDLEKQAVNDGDESTSPGGTTVVGDLHEPLSEELLCCIRDSG